MNLWSKTSTWMLLGVGVVVLGAVVGAVAGNREGTNPLIAVGVLIFLVGAFVGAYRRGVRKRDG